MNVCGKALPPKAAALLVTNALLLVICVPVLLAASGASITSGPGAMEEYRDTALRLGAIGLFTQIVFYYFQLYNLQIARDIREQVWRMLAATGIVMVALAAVFWILPELSPGRDALLGLPFASLAALLLTRQLATTSRSATAILIGPRESCRVLAETIARYPEWNLRCESVDAAASIKALVPLHRRVAIVVCADAQLDSDMLETLMEQKLRGSRVESAAQFLERATGRVQLDQINSEWFIYSQGFQNGRRRLLVKRCFDLLLAVPVAVITFPVMIAAAVAIAIEGNGPLFYRQDRVGLYGKRFKIVKLRTMIPMPPDATPQWTQTHDRRITRLGKFMRKFRIDELPQLLNVIKGDMSLVGPRPEQPYFCDMLAREIPFYLQRHTVPPGLTGWAQVRYMYGASVEESRQKLEFDLFYVKHLSLWLDLAIAFETLKVVLVGQGAK